MRRGHLALVSALLLATQAVAAPVLPAASDPGAIQQRQMDEERRRQEAERQQRKPVAEPLRRDVAEPPVGQPGPEVVRFHVREIRFTKSEILSSEELEAVARDFRGRDLGLADLQQLAARINELYRRKGVVTAQAVVPPQDVSTGSVLVRLVEGRMGKVRIDGNDSTNERYVTDRLGLQPEDLVDLVRLEAALVRFNRTNDSQLKVELIPGERFATTDLRVLMTEPPRHDFRATLDNQGSMATGRERVGVSYLNRSLVGFRDDLGLSATHATGQDSHSITYGFPVNIWGGRFNLGYYSDDIAIRSGPLASLRITGKSTASVLSLRQPVLVEPAAQIDVVAGGKQRSVSNWIDKVFLQRTDTTDENLGIEAQLFGSDSTWFASLVRSVGNYRVGLQSGRFTIDRGSIRHQHSLGEGLTFRGSVAWQSTHQVLLPSSEQFFIGGEGSVRGYPVGAFSGDTGQVLNLELHHPLATAADTGGIVATGFFFLDHGQVQPFRPPNSKLHGYDSLTGLGWGIQATLGKGAYARVTFAYGPDRTPVQDRNYETTFQLVFSPF
ncbi:MAG: BamA/TamA family outer membrane protein [Gammaproteobacteria bacterium]|nr:BamA/TamA family outer membrane protein [Gammaproteobacteria bacterium]MBU1644722.1 BamA/TamA family outer membrane protein [Gammaproteobacteria bacterium]MBU1973456.1 BamA/TamA family outer membrane protein [Gammaproteobacteria bacterium]